MFQVIVLNLAAVLKFSKRKTAFCYYASAEVVTCFTDELWSDTFKLNMVLWLDIMGTAATAKLRKRGVVEILALIAEFTRKLLSQKKKKRPIMPIRQRRNTSECSRNIKQQWQVIENVVKQNEKLGEHNLLTINPNSCKPMLLTPPETARKKLPYWRLWAQILPQIVRHM